MTRTRRDPEAFLRALRKLDDVLADHGYPRISPWWWATIERFYRSGKRRLVVRKGRRVGASTIVAPRICVAEMLWGGHYHTPGAPPLVFAFLSIKREEAANRLRGIRAILDVLGERYREAGDTIELESAPAIAKVATANYRLTVGETIAWCWCDEVSRWRDDATGANPAEQVIGSIAPALATLPDATLWLVSSPLGKEDYHARSHDLGETPAQCVAFGETWVINPTLSEQQCQELEPDRKLFLREYAAIPSDAVSPALDPDDVRRCFVPRAAAPAWRAECVLILDPSKGRGDDSTACIARVCAPQHTEKWLHRIRTETTTSHGHCAPSTVTTEIRELVRDEHGNPVMDPNWRPVTPYVRIEEIWGTTGKFFGKLSAEEIVAEQAALARRWGAQRCFSDSMESFGLESLFRRHGLRFESFPWTNPDKVKAMSRLRRWLADGGLSICQHGDMLQQLLGLEEKISPSGFITYGARRGKHDDYAALLLTLAMVEEAGKLPSSPLGRRAHAVDIRMA